MQYSFEKFYDVMQYDIIKLHPPNLLYVLFRQNSDIITIKEMISHYDLSGVNELHIAIKMAPTDINLAEIFQPIIHQIQTIHIYYDQETAIDILKEYTLNLHEFSDVKQFYITIKQAAIIDCKLLPQSITSLLLDNLYFISIDLIIKDVGHLYNIRELTNLIYANFIGSTYLPNLERFYDIIYTDIKNACTCQKCLKQPHHLLDLDDCIDLLENEIKALSMT